MLVVYAAKEGEFAADGEGANSPFAAGLVKELAQPGIEVRCVFDRVRDDVIDATGGHQHPGGKRFIRAPLFHSSGSAQGRCELAMTSDAGIYINTKVLSSGSCNFWRPSACFRSMQN